jgi:hypothetical protein
MTRSANSCSCAHPLHMHARARENSHTIFFEQAGAPFPKSLKSENDGEGGEGRGGGGGDVSSPTSITDNTESGKADSGFANGAGGVRTMGRKWGGEPHGVEGKEMRRGGVNAQSDRPPRDDDKRSWQRGGGSAVLSSSPATSPATSPVGVATSYPRKCVREPGDTLRAVLKAHVSTHVSPAPSLVTSQDSPSPVLSPSLVTSPERSALRVWGAGALEGALGALNVLGVGVKGGGSRKSTPRSFGEEGERAGGAADANMSDSASVSSLSSLIASAPPPAPPPAWHVAGRTCLFTHPPSWRALTCSFFLFVFILSYSFRVGG